MKTIVIRSLLLICTMMSFLSVGAQSVFSTHTLADPFARATSLCMADLDGDGDQDIIAGSGVQGVFWYENMGEKPARFTSHTIDPGLKKVFTVVCGDLDQDGLVDVAAGSWDDHDVVWYRNTGDGGWIKACIDQNLINVHELFICDIDQDQKPDIIAAGTGENKVLWYRNEMGEANQWTEQLVDQAFGGVRTVAAADLDGDGDIDIVGGASDVHEVSVWMNLGGDPVEWAKTIITNSFTGSHRIQIVDINLDGRPDVLGAAWGVNEVAWWENNGDQADQWPKHVLNNALGLAMTALAADLDSDGDLDVIGAGLSGEVSWHENQNGEGSQWRDRVIDLELTGPWPVCAGDLDGDKDLDLVVGGDQGNQIRWYENTTTGLLNGFMTTPDGGYKTSIFIPEDYAGDSPHELLIALPGDVHVRAGEVLLGFLVPVAETRNCLIMTFDIPRAELPSYVWDQADYLQQVIDFARSGFVIDDDQIYIMGMTCQGQSVLQGAFNNELPVRGYIAFNPLIPSLQLDNWSIPTIPMAVAASSSHPDLDNINALKNHMNQEKLMMEQIDFSGPPTDYLIAELPELTIQCIEAIESIYTLGVDYQMYRSNGLSMSVSRYSSNGVMEVNVNGRTGDEIYVSVLDLQGKPIIKSWYQILGADQARNTLNIPSESMPSGLFLLRVTNQNGQATTLKIVNIN